MNKHYEYKVFVSLMNTEKKLNELGYEGWELVAVDSGTLYMRREIKVIFLIVNRINGKIR